MKTTTKTTSVKKSSTKAKNAIVENVTPVTKVINLTFYQNNGTKVETKFTLSKEAKTSLLIGTAINELFTLQSNYRRANIKLFKSSEPVLFMVSSDDMELLNIGKCSRVITDKLKFNKTRKSMAIFAKRVNLAVTELTRNITIIDYSKVEEAILSIAD